MFLLPVVDRLVLEVPGGSQQAEGTVLVAQDSHYVVVFGGVLEYDSLGTPSLLVE